MDRVIESIHPYPLYNEIIVDFKCRCWYSSRSESFHYNCPAHRETSDPIPYEERNDHL